MLALLIMPIFAQTLKQRTSNMKQKLSLLTLERGGYISPSCTAIQFKMEQFLCGSPDANHEDFDDPSGFDWEDND